MVTNAQDGATTTRMTQNEGIARLEGFLGRQRMAEGESGEKARDPNSSVTEAEETQPSAQETAEAAPEGPEQPPEGQEGEAAEGEAEGEAQPEEGQEKAPEEDKEGTTTTYRVKIDGQEKDVTLDDLIKGYLLEGHARRRIEEAAEATNAYEEKAQAFAAETQRYQQNLELAFKWAQTLIGDEPDWDALERADLENGTNTARRAEREWNRRKQQAQAVYQELQATHGKLSEMQQRQEEEARRAAERKLPTVIPEWFDAYTGAPTDQARQELSDLRRYLVDQGAPREVAANLFEPVSIAIARKAMLYDRLQTQVKPRVEKRVVAAPKVQKPGAAKTPAPPETERVRTLKRQHREKRNMESGTAALAALLSSQRRR